MGTVKSGSGFFLNEIIDSLLCKAEKPWMLTTLSGSITIKLSNAYKKGKVKSNDDRSGKNYAEGTGDDS
jgi:hypothetical protein